MTKRINIFQSNNEHKRSLQVICLGDKYCKDGVQFIVSGSKNGSQESFGLIISKEDAMILVENLISDLDLVVTQEIKNVTTVTKK